MCVRAEESPPAVSWLACWSHVSTPTAAQLRRFLQGIGKSIDETARVGPCGPILGRFEFFEDLDSWGVGSPRPIKEFARGVSKKQGLVVVGGGCGHQPCGRHRIVRVVYAVISTSATAPPSSRRRSQMAAGISGRLGREAT